MDIFQTDEIVEIPVSELQALYNSSVSLFNDILDIAREERLLDKKDSAEMLISAQNTIKNEKSPIQKLILLNAYSYKRLSSPSERP